MSKSNLSLWGSRNDKPVVIKSEETGLRETLSTAVALTDKEKNKIAVAVESQLYDMATEYIWKRTIANLKKGILKLGEEFVLEMMGKQSSIYNNIDDIVTEMDTINLAKELGLITTTAHLLLSQQSQLIKHFIENDEDEEMPTHIAISSICSCIQYGLSKTVEYDVGFVDFRKRLYTEILSDNDGEISLIIESEYFYIKTVTRTLINLIKTKEGGELDNTLNNFQFFIPKAWIKLLSEDKWLIGTLYAEMVSVGNKKVAGTVKSVLSKIRGFDYVPENLRSNTFIAAATEFKRVHYAMNNFYNEASAIEGIYKLGTIPSPAICDCISAAILCKLGNNYGVAHSAQATADKILDNIQDNKWKYYLENKMPVDNDILIGLYSGQMFERWRGLVEKYKLDKLNINKARIQKIINATIKKNISMVKNETDKLREGLIE